VRIACIGGGPAGLYFALLMKLSEPQDEITIFERSLPGATRGWGVVFWDDLLKQLYRADPQSARQIEEASFRWDGQVVDVNGRRVRDESLRGYGINRQRLLDVLTRRAQDAGVRVEFGHEVTEPSQRSEADLVVACDGVSSRTRLRTEGFQTDVQLGSNKYIWLGTDKVFETFTFPFVSTESGWVWAHAYGIDAKTSTFIIECTAETYMGLGFDVMPPGACLSLLEKIFASHLDGHHLIGQFPDGTNAPWLNFRTVTNKRWYHGTTVLAGDAAHTTHFTIGSGTKLAIEDAIALAGNLRRHGELELALRSYEGERKSALLQPQSDARLSAQWFENISRYIDVGPHQFFTLLHARRSLLLPHVSPRLYYQLHRAAQEVPVLGRLRRQIGTAGSKLYGWRKSRTAGPRDTVSPHRR
jgi:2-polyprenyl-6-methoxyphenol hydroxylase-like FAD-dependent oxidoreductase